MTAVHQLQPNRPYCSDPECPYCKQIRATFEMFEAGKQFRMIAIERKKKSEVHGRKLEQRGLRHP
jgi:glutaredoxin